MPERDQIIGALKCWAQSAPDEPMVGLLGHDRLMTPQELVEQVQQETPDGRAVLEMLEHGVRREGLTSVVARLSRRALAY